MYFIDQKIQAVISICGDDQNLIDSLQFKFAYDKLKLIQEELLKFSNINQNLFDYYNIILNYFKELCGHRSMKSTQLMFVGQRYTSIENLQIYNIEECLFTFVKKTQINHWFLSFVCLCENLTCFQNPQISPNNPRQCLRKVVISLDLVNLLISEVNNYIETFIVKPSNIRLSQRNSNSRNSN